MSDLRESLLKLYLLNNPAVAHRVYIYSYLGVVDSVTNPFQMVFADLPANVKKSLVMQNLASGEMLQAFIVPLSKGKDYKIDNKVLYGNKAGVLLEIDLSKDKVEATEKYKQFTTLVGHLMSQFIE